MESLLVDRPPATRELGAAIARARRRARLTQPELAARVNISQSHVSFIEQGRRRPEASVLQNIARVLDVPYRELAELAGYLPRHEGDRAVTVTADEMDDIVRFRDLPSETRRYLLEVAKLGKRMWPIEQVPNPPSAPTEQHDPPVDGSTAEEGDQEPDR